jgi:hypothetical protein
MGGLIAPKQTLINVGIVLYGINIYMFYQYVRIVRLALV